MTGPRIVASRSVPPDASIVEAVGLHHSVESALADLIDNSIDAGARHVRVRFLQRDSVVTGLQLIDDGSGMDASSIDGAMTYARKRDYAEADLGHFGLGLKAASLSQADELRVFSRSLGAPTVGRAIRAQDRTRVLELDPDDAAAALESARVDFVLDSGTVVEWAEPRSFLAGADPADHSKWLERVIALVLDHLGLVFHRLIAEGRVSISLDVFDQGFGIAGVPRRAVAIDPFGYSQAGTVEPRAVRLEVDGEVSVGTAHVWPSGQTGMREFRLGGRPGAGAQGFYFYRRDRLLQAGGWNSVVLDAAERELARVAIDLEGPIARHVTINPEKSGLELDATLKQALRGAAVGSTDLEGYLEDAERIRQEARTYTRRPVTLVEPGRGFSAEVRNAFEASVEKSEAEAIDIRWQVEFTDSPLKVDFERRTIWLNEQYRELIVGRGSMDADDAPLVKTLLLIAFSRYFEGSQLGPRQRAEIQAWEQLLTAALRDEIGQESRRLGES